MTRIRWRRGAVVAACAAALAAPLAAQTAGTSWRPAAVVAGFEETELPGGEDMGLAHAAYLVEFAPGWRIGPALYGAATGHRGGLFTWGVEGQQLWRFGGRWQAVAGLYVGGGGGASAPVGGGLMLRPHADLLYGFDGWALGVSASQVRFPNGDIKSSQLGLVVSIDDRFEYAAPGQRARFDASWLKIDRLLLGAGRYAEATPPSDSVGVVSLRAERDIGSVLIATAEAGAAVQGEGDGYAEFGAGLAALWPTPLPGVRVGGRAMLGMGGGGAVPTGGGVTAKAALLARWQVAGPWLFELEAGRVHAFTGDLDSSYAMLSLGRSFGSATGGAVTATQTEFLVATQSSRRAAPRRQPAPAGDDRAEGATRARRALLRHRTGLRRGDRRRRGLLGRAGRRRRALAAGDRLAARRRGAGRRGRRRRRREPGRRHRPAQRLGRHRGRPPRPAAARRRLDPFAEGRAVGAGGRAELGRGAGAVGSGSRGPPRSTAQGREYARRGQVLRDLTPGRRFSRCRAPDRP
ncbi:MAG: hypothetical protein MZW92_19190 [Comamonadaceae bacterium]|nr:hypothetical protein [Comamonadaceae bacterium]